jgi:hypothetical protein
MNIFSILFLLFISIYSKRITQRKNYISNSSDIRKFFFNNTVALGCGISRLTEYCESLRKTPYLKLNRIFQNLNQPTANTIDSKQALREATVNEEQKILLDFDRKFPDKNDLGFIFKIIFLLLV